MAERVSMRDLHEAAKALGLLSANVSEFRRTQDAWSCDMDNLQGNEMVSVSGYGASKLRAAQLLATLRRLRHG